VDAHQLRPLVIEAQYDTIGSMTREVLDLAGGLSIGHIDHFQVYVASTVNRPVTIDDAGVVNVGSVSNTFRTAGSSSR